MEENERQAIELIEFALWGDEPVCPRCESYDVRQVKNKLKTDRNERFLWRCHGCKKQFTVRIGTELENTKISLHIWIHAILESKNAFQLFKKMPITWKTAYYVFQRLKTPEIHIGLKQLVKAGKIKQLTYNSFEKIA
jgi:hypothetical protein